MEIIADLQTKKGVVYIHFIKGGALNDVCTWSPDYSTKEKVEVLKELQEYLKAEIQSDDKSAVSDLRVKVSDILGKYLDIPMPEKRAIALVDELVGLLSAG
jgi:hypothetical protein